MVGSGTRQTPFVFDRFATFSAIPSASTVTFTVT